MATIKIKQIKSRIGASIDQKRTLDALGLTKMHRMVEKEDNASLRGMINKVHHLEAAEAMGGTSTRGHKGAKQRSGYSKKIGFEGGQMPLQRRLPKFGFKNINRVEYKAINLSTIQGLAEAKGLQKVGVEELIAAGFISSKQLVKVLGNGQITSAIEVLAHAFSKSAETAIQAAVGTATINEKNNRDCKEHLEN